MKRNLALIFFMAIFFVSTSSSVFASQAMPRYGINDATKECSEFFMGDECTSCSLPAGWQVIKESECPDGYNKIQANSVCSPNKSAFCCTVQHSGANGDCEDVVVNSVDEKCAFVDDVDACEELPVNWSRAEDNKIRGRLCPSTDYMWLNETLTCGAEKIGSVVIDKEVVEKKVVDVEKKVDQQVEDPVNQGVEKRMTIQGGEQNGFIEKESQKIKIIIIVAVVVAVIISLFFIRKRVVKF